MSYFTMHQNGLVSRQSFLFLLAFEQFTGVRVVISLFGRWTMECRVIMSTARFSSDFHFPKVVFLNQLNEVAQWQFYRATDSFPTYDGTVSCQFVSVSKFRYIYAIYQIRYICSPPFEIFKIQVFRLSFKVLQNLPTFLTELVIIM